MSNQSMLWSERKIFVKDHLHTSRYTGRPILVGTVVLLSFHWQYLKTFVSEILRLANRMTLSYL